VIIDKVRQDIDRNINRNLSNRFLDIDDKNFFGEKKFLFSKNKPEERSR